jgi:hypothetical protein
MQPRSALGALGVLHLVLVLAGRAYPHGALAGEDNLVLAPRLWLFILGDHGLKQGKDSLVSVIDLDYFFSDSKNEEGKK